MNEVPEIDQLSMRKISDLRKKLESKTKEVDTLVLKNGKMRSEIDKMRVKYDQLN
jgi:regulator of replication initiation timing